MQNGWRGYLKILFVTLSVGKRIRSPEMELAEELARMGHDIVLVINPGSPYLSQQHPKKLVAYEMDIQAMRLDNKEINLLSKHQPYDVVYGGIEGASDITLQLGKQLGIPVVNHIEFFPPWRVGLEPPQRWGFTDFPVELMQQYIRFYWHHAVNLVHSNLVTIGSNVLKQNVYTFMEVYGLPKIKLEVMHLGIDTETADSTENQEEEESIIFVGRLVYPKKVAHLITALSSLKNAPTLNVIGSGPIKKDLESFAIYKGVKVNFLGEFSGIRKFKEIKRSMLMWMSWGSLPPGETLWCLKPCICYKSDYMVEMYGNTLEWVPWDNIQETANKIQWLIENPRYRRERGAAGREAIIQQRTNVWTLQDAAKDFEKILENVD